MSRVTPNNFLIKGLVAYYGLLQFFHLLALIRSFLSLAAGKRLGFPAMPPISGWSIQAQYFLIGMGFIDAVNVLLALVFVYSFFKMEKWWLSMGLVSLTAAICSAWIFGFGTVLSGAWSNHPLAYGVMVFLFSPVIILFIIHIFWCIKGRFSWVERNWL